MLGALAGTVVLHPRLIARCNDPDILGAAFYLMEPIGWSGGGAATEMLLSGRHIPAEEALAMKLVNRLFAPDALMPATLDYAKDIARNVSPRSTRVIKCQLWHAQRQTFMEAAIMAHKEAGRSLKTADFREGIAHFVEKRAPRFTGK